ncbi:MAG: hypothetical protein KDA84_13010 [Planctomycetaceae bacterium]|nr:hypothetical protein [Planctomycetaceae bacterium]
MPSFDPSQAKLGATYEVPGILYSMCWDADRSRLYGAGADKSVYCVDLNAEKPTVEKR